ncbi:MAG: hypothetical protein WCP28_05185 [Actinomycetes bacterium]
MTDAAPSIQRSFRLSASTVELLDAAAASGGESRNALADRLLAEALRTEHHPLIRFRTGAAGRREPVIVGTRLLVRQVVAQLKDADAGAQQVADALDRPLRDVRAAMSYYADFPMEVDADARWAADIEAAERARWEREQAAFA